MPFEYKYEYEMINKEALRFLKQYASRAITLEVAMEEIQYILESNFDEDEWMDIMQYILIDPLCFADIEKEFLEKLGEQESSNATTGSLSEAPCPSNPGTRNLPAADRDSESMPSTHQVFLSSAKLSRPVAQRSVCVAPCDGLGSGKTQLPQFDDRIREFGPRYVHAEWQPLITALFALSDPSNKTHGHPHLLSSRPCNPMASVLLPPQILTPSPSSWQGSPKRRKMGISKFFDLAAAEKDSDEDDEEEEDFGETRWRTSVPMNAGLSGKHSFNQAIDGMMARYSSMSQRRDIQTHKVSQIPRGSRRKVCALVALPTSMWRAPVQQSPNRLPPSHRSETQEIILLSPLRPLPLAAFEAQQMLPIRTWVRIKKGLYKVLARIRYVEICKGELSGSRGKLIDVEWQKRLSFGRVFSTGQTVRIIAGPYHGYVGHIIMASGGSVSLQYDGQSPHLEVSELLLETHVPDHVHSLSTKHDAGMRMNLPEPADKVLPGDTAVVCRGAYKGAEATIEWMNSNGDQVWIYVKEVSDSSSTQGDTGTTSTQHPSTQGDTDTASAQHPAGYKMVPVNVHDVRVHRAPRTISFTKEKGFDVCAGDDIEVARGKWFRSRGTVQAVHFDQACLDFVCDAYGQNISVPITFCRKIAERSAAQLWRWVGRDVWVIHGEKKGYQGTLRSTGQGVSQVALQGQLVQLRNNHIATPTGLVLDGTLLPLGTVQELQHRSFVTVVRSITPPPSAPSPVVEGSSTVTSDAWRVTAEDLTPTASVYGEIPWLFRPNFCDFTRLLLGFTVNDHYRPYNNASIGKRIV
ncbi:hypothetical protein EDD16DRAFT_1521623 [Pisolithus croceorrhizus]|nr:hypothetical protein EDD16DRAFT_1521623 [Pisolithus croceorrhizus]